MLIYLVRHAIAIDREPSGLFSDRARPLTSKGIKKMQRIARALRRLGVSPGEIWSSPFVRARQTAEILRENLEPMPTVEIVESLIPGSPAEAVIAQLRASQRRFESIALVGHQPDLGELAGKLLGTIRGTTLQIRKGGVVCIRIADLQPPLSGELCWMATPKILSLISPLH